MSLKVTREQITTFLPETFEMESKESDGKNYKVVFASKGHRVTTQVSKDQLLDMVLGDEAPTTTKTTKTTKLAKKTVTEKTPGKRRGRPAGSKNKVVIETSGSTTDGTSEETTEEKSEEQTVGAIQESQASETSEEVPKTRLTKEQYELLEKYKSHQIKSKHMNSSYIKAEEEEFKDLLRENMKEAKKVLEKHVENYKFVMALPNRNA